MVFLSGSRLGGSLYRESAVPSPPGGSEYMEICSLCRTQPPISWKINVPTSLGEMHLPRQSDLQPSEAFLLTLRSRLLEVWRYSIYMLPLPSIRCFQGLKRLPLHNLRHTGGELITTPINLRRTDGLISTYERTFVAPKANLITKNIRFCRTGGVLSLDWTSLNNARAERG